MTARAAATVVDLDEDLLECIEKGDIAGARAAIEGGANVNSKDTRSEISAMHYAAYVKTLGLALDMVRKSV